jgi:hypothetical protein
MEGVTSGDTSVTSGVTPEFATDVPEEVPESVPEEVTALPTELSTELPTATLPRIRKVRVNEPAPPPPMATHVYWGDRLQEHRATQRSERDARYVNLRIM